MDWKDLNTEIYCSGCGNALQDVMAVDDIKTEIIEQILEDSKTMTYEHLNSKWNEKDTSR